MKVDYQSSVFGTGVYSSTVDMRLKDSVVLYHGTLENSVFEI